jgi:hypothetical protein
MTNSKFYGLLFVLPRHETECVQAVMPDTTSVICTFLLNRAIFSKPLKKILLLSAYSLMSVDFLMAY